MEPKPAFSLFKAAEPRFFYGIANELYLVPQLQPPPLKHIHN